MKEPRCPKCEAIDSMGWTTKMFGGLTGKLIFCERCGVTLNWVPDPLKQK